MLTWIDQDLRLAHVLKDYGFTSVSRVNTKTLSASFDNGPLIYPLPHLCFMFLPIGATVTIDELITLCEVYHR